ncbi:hypothetical protein ES708_33584 [subsurface metagenome]
MSLIIDSAQYKSGEIINTYDGFEPRISARIKLNNSNALKIAYTYTKQYLHLLSNSTVGLPTDTWIPPDNHIKPQSANHFILGYYHTFKKKNLELSIEGYYKSLHNIIDYIDNADLFINKNIETQILHGQGESYGLEFLLEKKIGRFIGWGSYTLAKTQYQIIGINKNQYYSPRHDIRHNITFTGNFKLSKAWMLSSTFVFASGGFITIPDQVFSIDGAAFFDYSSRNNYELPPNHRLDLSVIYNSRKNETRRFKSKWILSIYNIYNHKNIYTLYVRQTSIDFTSASSYKMYLFGIVPTISYNFSF